MPRQVLAAEQSWHALQKIQYTENDAVLTRLTLYTVEGTYYPLGRALSGGHLEVEVACRMEAVEVVEAVGDASCRV